MTWKRLQQVMTEWTEAQLNKEVVGLIDGEPWKPDCVQIADHDDPDFPNNPYLLFK